MHGTLRSTVLLAGAALLASGCAALNTSKERGAVVGAGTGAAIGAVIGNQTGSTARGAVIGAVLGGTAGAVIGHQMDQKAKEITASVPGATVTRVGEGLVITFDSGILFDFNSDALRPEARTNLDNLAANLSGFGDSKLLLVGHTDSVGTNSYNQTLSERRATSVGNYLVSKGVPRTRVEATGRGETEPIQANDSEAGRLANRRVEIAVTAGEQMKAAAKKGGGN